MKLLVTDGDERACLAVVRSLGREHEVHVCGAHLRSLAGSSRFAKQQHRVPGPGASEGEFRSALRDVVRQFGIEAVLPISDGAHRALLRGEDLGASLIAPEPAAYERLSDKAEVTRLAGQFGIQVPRTVEATHLEAAREASARIGWPVVLKPARSLVAPASQQGQAKLGVAVAGDDAAISQAWPEVSPAGTVLVQSFVPGRGEGIFVLRRGGRSMATFAHRRLREKPPGGGVSVLRESTRVDPDLLSRVEGILDALEFEGVAMAEFRVHGTDRWLMEFNARLWGSLQLAIDAGVDFPRLMLDAHTKGIRGTAPAFRTGVRLRWLLGDLDHALLLARGIPDTEGRSGLKHAFGVLVGSNGPRCSWEVLRAEDPVPFLVELGRWLRPPRVSRGV